LELARHLRIRPRRATPAARGSVTITIALALGALVGLLLVFLLRS
jgi:hypothetical protein